MSGKRQGQGCRHSPSFDPRSRWHRTRARRKETNCPRYSTGWWFLSRWIGRRTCPGLRGTGLPEEKLAVCDEGGWKDLFSWQGKNIPFGEFGQWARAGKKLYVKLSLILSKNRLGGHFNVCENGSAGSPSLFCNVTGGSGQFAQAYRAETGPATSGQVNSTELVETNFACAG